MDQLLHPLDSDRIAALPHETPFFLVSKDSLVRNLELFQRLFPGAAIHYAVKANSERELLRTLFTAGASFEAASKYELRMLLSIGIPAENVIYGTSVKPSSHIREFHERGVDRFAFDCAAELEKIAAVAPGSRVYVRLSTNDAGSVFKFSEKFGTDPHNAALLLRRARDLGLHPYGVSFHVGSQARNAGAWADALEDVAVVLENLSAANIRLEVIDIGGGFPCRYAFTEVVPALPEIAESVSAHLKDLPYRPQLLLEPGRGLVADAAALVTSVIARIERQGQTWLFLDVGVYNGLFEAMAYQGSTRYPIESIRFSNSSGEALFALAGPTGDSPDIITREALLPRDMDVGDRLIVRNAGAYTLSVTSEFNGFPKPTVYFV